MRIHKKKKYKNCHDDDEAFSLLDMNGRRNEKKIINESALRKYHVAIIRIPLGGTQT